MNNYYKPLFHHPIYFPPHIKQEINNESKYESQTKSNTKNTLTNSQSTSFEIFGLKLTKDDILILLLILFLYLENSKDILLYVLLFSLLFD